MINVSLNRWIGTALALLLLLMLTLAWLGFSASRTQDRMVREVLQDYAQLIADTYVSALHSEIGFRRLYPLTQQLEAQGFLNGDLEIWNQESLPELVRTVLGVDALLAVFYIDKGSQSLGWLMNENNESRAVAEAYLAQARPEIPPPFEVTHLNKGQAVHTLIAIPKESGETVLLIKGSALEFWFQQIFEQRALLPEAFGNPDSLRPHIYLSVRDTRSTLIYQSSATLFEGLASSATIKGEYAGMFKDFEVKASIHPSVASELMIGELPYGRLPFIVVLLFVAVALGVVSFILLRKQRQLMELRTDFVARVSHELRTPLTQIRMFTESLMLQRLSKTEDQQLALKVIHRETGRLTRLVDNILLFEREGQIRLKSEPESYSLAQLCHQLEEDFQPILDSRDAILEIHCPEALHSKFNRGAVVQILTNLLDNSLKYGPKGQTIYLSASRDQQVFVLSVCDQGPGIPEAECERIFQAYYRLEKEKKDAIAGTGIGLSVSRELATELGGTLIAKPRPGGGSCFVFSVPEAD